MILRIYRLTNKKRQTIEDARIPFTSATWRGDRLDLTTPDGNILVWFSVSGGCCCGHESPEIESFTVHRQLTAQRMEDYRKRKERLPNEWPGEWTGFEILKEE